MRAAFRIASIAAAGALAACSFIPTYERPAPPVPEAFPQPAASAGTPAPQLAWIDFLHDPRLRQLVQLALDNNRDLRVAVLNIEQARAQLGATRADQWPTVNGVASGSRAPSAANGRMTNTFTAGVAVSSYELDFFGRVRSLGEAAAARYLASEEGRRAAQGSLVAAVASADLALRADDELLAVTQRTLQAREDTLQLVKVRFDGGVSAAPELRAAESLAAAARANLAALQRQRALDQNALVLLLGTGLPAGLPVPGPLADTTLADVPAGVPSEVLLQRPDVRQAEQQLIAANANIGAARAAFFPRIALTGSAGFASNELSGLFDNTAWSFAGNLVQPLFDAGRNRANLEAAQATRAIAVAQYEKAIQVAFREVADALAGRATLGEQLAAQQAQAVAEEQRLALAEQLFKGGAASGLDRLDAERSALAARQAVVQLQLARLQNAVLLYRVLGGGAEVAAAR